LGKGLWDKNTSLNTITHAVYGDGKMALGGSIASEMLHVYGNAKITGNIISGGNVFAKDELRIGNAAGEYVPVFMKKNAEGTKKILSFGSDVLPSGLTNNCFNNASPWSFVFTDGIFAANWQNPNNVVRLTHDGAHGILESGTNSPPSPGVQGLFINYYCGEDVAICTGTGNGVVSTGRNLEVGFPIRNLGNSININSINKRGIYARSENDPGTYGYNIQSSVNRATTKAFAVEFRDAGIDKETFLVYGNGTTHIGEKIPLPNGPHADAKLSVDGKGLFKSLYVNISANVWPDYVFESDYRLMPTIELEAYIKKHKHLPEVPSAKEIEEKGMSVEDMNVLLLKKVEELTLRVIDLEKRINSK
jgi:hypothetical protein